MPPRSCESRGCEIAVAFHNGSRWSVATVSGGCACWFKPSSGAKRPESSFARNTGLRVELGGSQQGLVVRLAYGRGI
jgi:hypothetical protein